jgi:hypothetical protein
MEKVEDILLFPRESSANHWVSLGKAGRQIKQKIKVMFGQPVKCICSCG